MLCRISVTHSVAGGTGEMFLIEVPDELFMRHMMMYGDFKPAQLSDNEYYSCTLLGAQKSMRYVGSSTEPTNERKVTK